MPRTKVAAAKKTDIVETEEVSPKKIISPIDLDDETVSEDEEKSDAESSFAPEGEDELGLGGEEVSLDAEELDPFGDKWEE